MSIPNSWLFPYDRRFSVSDWLSAHSPRAWDTPNFAKWVDEAARVNNLNAKWLLMTAEKEQSFITRRAGGPGWDRAVKWTMGYGATDGGDIPRFAGTENQVRSAAKGLRAYLTPGHKLYIGDNVGKPFKCLDGYYTPVTLAEAAQLQYTPWVKYLPDTRRVWESLFGKEAPAMPHNPADIAEEVVAGRRAGYRKVTVNSVTFDTEERGYCSRFVRLAHLAAGLPTDAFGCCAHRTGQNLRGQGRQITTSARGDILVFGLESARCSVCGQTVGHIGIDLGGGLVAENTSSGKRGLPMRAGTKISHLSEIGPSRLTGRYSLRVAAPAVDYSPGPIVVKVNDVAYLGEFDGSTAFLAGHEVRREAEAAGCVPPRGQVVAHFAETPRTVYVYGPWRVPAGAVRWVRE